jgi:hypothetical protein
VGTAATEAWPEREAVTVRESPAPSPRFVTGLFSAALATVGLLCSTPLHAGDCDGVVTYFTYPPRGESNPFEWRIFDPSRRTDTLFLARTGGFSEVCWDTTFDNAYFSWGDSLYRIEWRIGAKPRSVMDLPAGTRHWWFDPDSGCWQALRLLRELQTDDPHDERYEAELWQSDRGATAWHLVRADSVYADLDEEQWYWFDESPLVNETSSVTLDDLASEAWDVTWLNKIAFIDTATFVVSNDTNRGYTGDQWFFLPLEASPRRGVAFHWLGPMAPEHNWLGIGGPFYFVDLDRRTKALIERTDYGLRRSLAAEHCGLLLLPDREDALVLDSSGHRVFTRSSSSREPVWVPRPRE